MDREDPELPLLRERLNGRQAQARVRVQEAFTELLRRVHTVVQTRQGYQVPLQQAQEEVTVFATACETAVSPEAGTPRASCLQCPSASSNPFHHSRETGATRGLTTARSYASPCSPSGGRLRIAATTPGRGGGADGSKRTAQDRDRSGHSRVLVDVDWGERSG